MLLSICLIFCQCQPGGASKSVPYIKKRVCFSHPIIFLVKHSWSTFECRSFCIVWTMWQRVVLDLGKNFLFVLSVTLEFSHISLFTYTIRCLPISGTFLTTFFIKLSIFFYKMAVDCLINACCLKIQNLLKNLTSTFTQFHSSIAIKCSMLDVP